MMDGSLSMRNTGVGNMRIIPITSCKDCVYRDWFVRNYKHYDSCAIDGKHGIEIPPEEQIKDFPSFCRLQSINSQELLLNELEDLLNWIRINHPESMDIRDHIDLRMGKIQNEVRS